MKKIIVVVGARPQFVKAAPVCAALEEQGLPVSVLHTGQHYDRVMSQVFFEELRIPEPAWNLGCGGETHGAMTGAMLAGIEKVLLGERPDMVIVFGDTNSTLAGALAAAKLHIPVAHVEAGLRSFNRRMPEELNRICTDHLSELLFCSSETGRDLLAREGITRGVEIAGDVMADIFLDTLAGVRAEEAATGAATAPGPGYALLTLHRAENTEVPARLGSIFEALAQSGLDIVFPVHPRTRDALEALRYPLPENIRIAAPSGYRRMVSLLNSCSLVLTDSGGLQKEALWAGKPCITLRDETEWVETTACGWNIVTGADKNAILAAVLQPPPAGAPPACYGDGQASRKIARSVSRYIKEGRNAVSDK